MYSLYQIATEQISFAQDTDDVLSGQLTSIRSHTREKRQDVISPTPSSTSVSCSSSASTYTRSFDDYHSRKSTDAEITRPSNTGSSRTLANKSETAEVDHTMSETLDRSQTSSIDVSGSPSKSTDTRSEYNDRSSMNSESRTAEPDSFSEYRENKSGEHEKLSQHDEDDTLTISEAMSLPLCTSSEGSEPALKLEDSLNADFANNPPIVDSTRSQSPVKSSSSPPPVPPKNIGIDSSLSALVENLILSEIELMKKDNKESPCVSPTSPRVTLEPTQTPEGVNDVADRTGTPLPSVQSSLLPVQPSSPFPDLAKVTHVATMDDLLGDNSSEEGDLVRLLIKFLLLISIFT